MSRSRRDTRRRATQGGGFTLVEALVAIAVFGIVATIVFGGFSQTMRNRRFVEAQSDRAHVVRVAMERMVREISSAFVSVHVNPNPQLITMRSGFHGRREGAGARLDFTSFSHRRLYRDAHESDQNEVGYFVADYRDEDGHTHTALVRREQNRIDEDFERGGQNAILVEDVREFELSFLDPLSLEWRDSWDASGSEMNRLPVQVKIRLVVPQTQNERHDEVYTTRAMVPINWALNHAVYNP
ncbi:MAG: prepilin-type N-terminal cleavage/methylation domain-containing protein [Sandaracinaceae bacterium]|nr:prepilin-type N-terminal cleavage/methylation domain-containing protein [Sandaracinaceae bacterium]